MRRRIKSVGEPIVSLTDAYPLAVVFVIAMRTKDGESRRTPIGTGFLVTVPSEVSDDTDVVFLYAVTASHVIASGEPTWLRFNTMSGGVEDLPVHEWFSADPVSDVAVTPVTPTQSMRWAFVPADGFLDSHS